MADKDIAMGILNAAVATAGLLLVYSGFLVAKANEYQSRRSDKFLLVARASIVPVLAALFSAWLCLRVVTPDRFASAWASAWLIFCFEITVALTAIYAIIAVIFSAL